MVKAKITKNNNMERQIKRIQRRAVPEMSRFLKREIRESIERGVTPVAKVSPRRFTKYSDSYKDQINAGRYPGKRVRPVNLTLTGKMLRSLKVTFNKSKGSITTRIDSPLADIHNRLGAGASQTVRRLLPTEEGEQLSSAITKKLREIVNNAVKKVLR